MKGNLTIHFSTLFTDTIKTHGKSFAYGYYVLENKMPLREFTHWLTVAGKV